MPIVKRPTYDMIEMCSWVDIAVNPVNCKGAQGAGLALAFKQYCPEQFESYKELCIAGKLVMGKLHVFHYEKDDTTIINLPTKYHWVDQSDLNDIELGLQTLVRYLEQYPLKTVAIPMLGTGLGKLEQKPVLELFEKYLDPLPNVIFVCMRPDAFKEGYPKYLMVGGSRKYLDIPGIEEGIQKGLDSFGLSYSDFTAGVSGGAVGVDKIAGGTGIFGDNQPNVFNNHNLKSIVARADWDRYGKTAGFVRNKTALEIGTHFILFVGKISVGTRMMKDLVEKHNKKADHIFKEECSLNHVKDYSFPMAPTKAWKKLFVVDISNVSE